MEHKKETDKERVFDLDLDNKKLILIFLVIVAVCGSFFIAGYIMGNRGDSPPMNYAGASVAGNNSGMESYNRMNGAGNERDLPPSAVTVPPLARSEGTSSKAVVSASVQTDPLETTAVVPASAATDVVKTKPVETTSAVSAAAPVVTSVPPVSVNKPDPQPKETTGKTANATAPKITPPAKQAAVEGSLYSVQVAAFRARREAETKARELEAKGFEYRIELPPTPGDYYRIKVGNFATRAAAGEMANRLKENGFDTMITQNKGN